LLLPYKTDELPEQVPKSRPWCWPVVFRYRQTRRKARAALRKQFMNLLTRHEAQSARPRGMLKPIVLPDLLMHYLLNLAAGSETATRDRIDLELPALRR